MNNTQREPASADEAVERYAEEHAAEWREPEVQPPYRDFADYVFDTLTKRQGALAAYWRTQQ